MSNRAEHSGFVTAGSTAGEDHGAFPNGTIPFVVVYAHREGGCLTNLRRPRLPPYMRSMSEIVYSSRAIPGGGVDKMWVEGMHAQRRDVLFAILKKKTSHRGMAVCRDLLHRDH